MTGTPHPLRRRALLAGTAGLVTFAVVRRTLTAASAGAATRAVAMPGIDRTEKWGARPPAEAVTLLADGPNKIIVHHTVSENTSDLSRAQAHDHAHWVQDLHIDDNGWTDTGYHFVNSRGGWLTEGRHQSLSTLTEGSGMVLGAHTSGQNYEAIGIANEGTYHDGATPPTRQWDALVDMCAYVCQQYGIPSGEIYGHKDFGATECPGVFHDMLPRLRGEVADALG